MHHGYNFNTLLFSLNVSSEMASIIDSVHNEWSHEIGHNWIGGHYVGCYDGTVHSPSSHSNSAWGWDSKKRKFIQNFSRTNSGKNTCMSKEYKSPENTYCTDKCREPFLGKYQYDTGSMGGGKGSNSGDGKNYAFYSPAEAKVSMDNISSLKFIICCTDYILSSNPYFVANFEMQN